MTMNAMVEYLEKRGFEVTKTYSSISKHYIFEIGKNGKYVSDKYTYNPHLTTYKINDRQREFMDGLIEEWNKKFNKENDMKDLNNIDWSIDSVEYTYGSACDLDHYEVNITGTVRKNTGYIHPDYVKTHLAEKLNAGNVDEFKKYAQYDVDTLGHIFNTLSNKQKTAVYHIIGEAIQSETNPNRIPEIKRVIFNDPATIVFWTDNTKTVVKRHEDDIYDPEKGLAMAMIKKYAGNQGNYYNIFKKWLPEEYFNDNGNSVANNDAFKSALEKWKDELVTEFRNRLNNGGYTF